MTPSVLSYSQSESVKRDLFGSVVVCLMVVVVVFFGGVPCFTHEVDMQLYE